MTTGPADAIGHLARRIRIDVDHTHRCTVGGKPFTDRSAESLATPRHHGNRLVKVEEIRHNWMLCDCPPQAVVQRSSARAPMVTSPTKISWAKAPTPSSESPLLKSERKNAPMSVPTMVPRPPERLAPPMIN